MNSLKDKFREHIVSSVCWECENPFELEKGFCDKCGSTKFEYLVMLTQIESVLQEKIKEFKKWIKDDFLIGESDDYFHSKETENIILDKFMEVFEK